MGRSISGFTVNRTGGRFGPFENQMFLGDYTLSIVMRATTDQGIEVVMQKQFNIASSLTEYRLDVLFGTAVLNTEMCGILLFDQ